MSLKPKYRRVIDVVEVGENKSFSVSNKENECHAFMLYNAGNINVTVFGSFVLIPSQYWSSPPAHPDIVDYTSLQIQFDLDQVPAVVMPSGGTRPRAIDINAGDPPPDRDPRLLIFREILKDID